MPLFVKLIFTQIRSWKGYWLPTSTMIPAEISTIIVDTFDLAEKKFGKMVVSHAVRYNEYPEKQYTIFLSFD